MDFPNLIIWISPLSFLGESGVIFDSFFDENSESKQNSPRCDATFCIKRTPGLNELNGRAPYRFKGLPCSKFDVKCENVVNVLIKCHEVCI